MAESKTERRSAAEYLPPRLSLKSLREAVQGCEGCDLYQDATQAVFGQGPRGAQVVFVGEQPGDQEDQRGEPFIGPAGHMLDKAMEEAGLDRRRVYVTNAVKHFKWTPRGKRRIHAKPTIREQRACRPWLDAEVQLIKPQVLVALGATAAKSLFGPDFRVTKQRGDVFESSWAPSSMATLHPSAILRVPGDEARRQSYADFVEDMSKVAQALAAS